MTLPHSLSKPFFRIELKSRDTGEKAGFSKGALESDTDEHSELLISKVIAPAL